MLDETLQTLATQAHSTGKILVLVTGVFDLLHDEHRRFLAKAKAAGDILVVGIEDDNRVRQLKGEGRPIQKQQQRLQQLQELGVADYVFVLPAAFGDKTVREQFMRDLKPQVLAVSSHSPFLEAKQKFMAEIGGEVKIVHQHNPAVSTSQLLAAA